MQVPLVIMNVGKVEHVESGAPWRLKRHPEGISGKQGYDENHIHLVQTQCLAGETFPDQSCRHDKESSDIKSINNHKSHRQGAFNEEQRRETQREISSKTQKYKEQHANWD